MKKFKFRFESILKMRQEKETQIGRILAEEVGVLERIEQSLRQCLEEISAFEKEKQAMAIEGVVVADIQRVSAGVDRLRKKRDDILIQKQQQEEEVFRCKLLLIEAMKDRKTMEKLKEKAFAGYIEEFERNESKTIEEIVNYRNSL